MPEKQFSSKLLEISLLLSSDDLLQYSSKTEFLNSVTRIKHSGFFTLFGVYTCPDQCFVWFAAMFSQISCLKSRKIQTAWISLNSYRSKTSRAFSEPGMWARALIFWVVTCGTHRYYQNTLQRDLKHFWKSCHPNVGPYNSDFTNCHLHKEANFG